MRNSLNRRAILATAIALVVSQSAAASPAGKLVERLNTLIGQPVDAAFDILGYPDRKEVYGPDMVYYWGVDQPEGPSCTYHIAAGADNLIKKTSAYGNFACADIGKKLKRK